jgi:ketosteroid isomerase-like protein
LNKPDQIRSEVIETEQRWVQAHRELDVDTLDEIMADEFLSVQSNGSLRDKAGELRSYRSGKRHWDFAESDQHRLQIYGDTAVLVGRWRARGINNGEVFDYAARFISVYARKPEGWKMVSAQSTPIPGATSQDL